MRVGVISDTHVPASARRVPDEALIAFEGVDLILHAGDITEWEVIETLERVAPVAVVRGNVDEGETAERLQPWMIVPVGKYRIGLTHGAGKPGDLISRVHQQFLDKDVHAIVFGHTHEPTAEWIGGVLMLNPGSPTSPRNGAGRTVGVLHLEDELRADIIPLP